MADGRTDHDAHDPLLIAALLDRDASATERAAADDRRRSCPDCAALYADLLALAGAVREQPAAPRARDFALTAADADRLTAERAGEPGPAATRLSGVMTMRPDTAGHAGHDTMLVASLADHSSSAADRASAEALIDACDHCAELHTDLVTLAAATRRLPTPARPRDYTLTAGEAARLRSPWRRFLGAIGSPRDALSKPLAVGLTTLGIAGLLVTAVPSMSFGSASSSAGGPAAAPPAAATGAGAPGFGVVAPEASGASDLSGEAATAAGASVGPVPAAAGASAVPGQAALPDAASSQPSRVTIQAQPQPSPATVVAPLINGSGKATGSGDTGLDQGANRDGALSSTTSGPSLSLVSAVLLAVGLVLFGIRRVARRAGDR